MSDGTPCKNCEIEIVKEEVEKIKKKEEFPNILYLIRYNPKQAIPWIIIVIVAVSSLGHIQFEPVFTAIMITLGVSPVIISSVVRLFR